MTQNKRIVLNVVDTYRRVVDGDGGGGLTAVEMVKYTASDDGKNGQI